ncbi:MAG: NAD-dependent epimerase/dehydratase family protein [Acidobacteriia bacterium]|nr:NAD-dependent epimerase/dehydratase family protein [Terriglobia bacterium]
MNYQDRQVLITGGLGFIGSNLAIRLCEMGAQVTIVDPSIPGCGANLFNIEPVRGQVSLIPASISDRDAIEAAIGDCPVIFNLAGEISHLHSMNFPERDLEINTLSQLRFLLAVSQIAPGARVVYAGTRQVYGAPDYLPVDEKHPIKPVDFNGVHKYAATMYHSMLSDAGQLDAVVLRLTNVYGPRMALDVPCQGFLATYLRKLLTGRQLEIFGDGRQLRDPMYVDDAVQAMLLAGAAGTLPSRSYNVGGPEPLSLASIASTGSHLAGVAPPRFCEFPDDRKRIDIGSYYTDCTRIREEFGWVPETKFEDGFERTLAYYQSNLSRYLDLAQPNPPCKLAQHYSAQAAPKSHRVPA